MIVRKMRIEDVAGIARVHARTWQTTYRGIIPDAYLDAIQVEEWQQRWLPDVTQPAPNTSGYVAENEENGEIVGFVRGGPTRYPDLPYRGELYAIYILKEYQQHGLGRRLVRELARDLQAAGLSEMLLWVLEGNHASRRFYEALGGQYVKTNDFEIGGVSVNECAYAWTDLTPFLQEGRA
ncbi:MAG TPA: GNAT family N-acetyltransferase [Ktedonobacteraceae bacterium]